MQNIVLISISESTIKSIVEEAVKNALAEHQPNEQLNEKVVDLEGLLTARPFIGSRSTIYKKVSKGLIPHSKQGKKLFFDLQIIDQWLLENKVKSPSEIEAEATNYLQRKNRR